MSSNLRRQLDELRVQLAMLRSPTTDADLLRECFTDPRYDEHREAIVEALIAGRGYKFDVDPDPYDKQGRSSYTIFWTGRGRLGEWIPPYVLHCTERWRDQPSRERDSDVVSLLDGRDKPVTPSPLVEDVAEAEQDDAERERLAKIAELRRQIAETQAHMDAIDAQIEAARQRSPAEPEPYPPRRHPLMGKRF